jgi:general secretion pathway protein J
MSGPLAGQRGMTLIELLVAMSVLAILSVLGYRAFSALLLSREHLMDTATQWIELARVFRRVERDVQGMPPQDEVAASAIDLRLEHLPQGMRLSLLRTSAWSRGEVERVRYQSNEQGLSWSSSRAGELAYPLLPAGHQVHWRLLLADGRWVEQWPDGGGGQLRALEMRVAHPVTGPVTRLWSLP